MDERYLQVVAGCKHFAPYDGLASSRASDYDLFSTYLPGYKRCMEAKGKAACSVLESMVQCVREYGAVCAFFVLTCVFVLMVTSLLPSKARRGQAL